MDWNIKTLTELSDLSKHKSSAKNRKFAPQKQKPKPNKKSL